MRLRRPLPAARRTVRPDPLAYRNPVSPTIRPPPITPRRRSPPAPPSRADRPDDRQTLQRAGFVPCGHILKGTVSP